ncbi:MAG: T9SS type A sorting domain-containing protein [Bacteroidetes bacterium]|nr:T9SS type A sorting domain-containing protein [Bacteroidota bacterium]
MQKHRIIFVAALYAATSFLPFVGKVGFGLGGVLFAQYMGGNADGHSLTANETYVAPCSLPGYANISAGGNADGHAMTANETYVAPCSLPGYANISAGGNADGHAMTANETYVAPCSLPAYFNLYKGGDGSVGLSQLPPTCASSGSELIVNGDFSAGNTGFTSAYTYIPPNTQIGPSAYTVGPNPATSNPGFWQGSDHTTGTGNFMLVDGAGVVVSVWCQTVNVSTNTDYLFSTWLTSLHTDNPAQLQASFNGVNTGSIFYAPAAFNKWIQVGTLWNSGSNTTASICIVNENTAGWGNDFGLDDISFRACDVCFRPLPVELMSFTAACSKGTAKLNWSTASETNNDYFSIERSADGITYEAIGKVKGAGNSSMTTKYTFTDNAPPDGTSYYRLKQTDYNGSYTYSQLASYNKANCSLSVYPNPFDKTIYVNSGTGTPVNALFRIVNVLGQEVCARNIIIPGDGTSVAIDLPLLASGMYMVHISDTDNSTLLLNTKVLRAGVLK